MARQLFLAVLLCLGFVLPVCAIDVEVGQWIEVKATTPQGVPVHRNPQPSLVERLRDGTRAKVAELANDGHWPRLNYGTGKTGWIIDRYVGRVVSEPPPTAGPDQIEQAIWTSQQACMQQVTAGRRAAPTSPDKLRVGSWNIRWFPDETNVQWLACTIAWMNVDVLALIEIRDTQDAKDAMARVLLLLESLTQAPWAVDLHQCGPSNMQHVGFLWNTTRATLSDQSDMWAFNARGTATGNPCAGNLRPGRYAYVKGAGSGVDFHAISAHLKSGSTGAARAERLAVFERSAMSSIFSILRANSPTCRQAAQPGRFRPAQSILTRNSADGSLGALHPIAWRRVEPLLRTLDLEHPLTRRLISAGRGIWTLGDAKDLASSW
jgi:hypothetical protein